MFGVSFKQYQLLQQPSLTFTIGVSLDFRCLFLRPHVASNGKEAVRFFAIAYQVLVLRVCLERLVLLL